MRTEANGYPIVLTFSIKKRINTELFIDGTSAFSSGWRQISVEAKCDGALWRKTCLEGHHYFLRRAIAAWK